MSVTIPNSVTNIGDYAFQGCRLSSVTIPYMVTSIGQNAFSNCYKLNSIYLPAHFRGVTATFGLPDTCEILFYLSFDDVTTDSSIIWLSPGDADWFQRQDESRSFIQSGTISSCSTSSIETVLSGPGTITFDWYVSGNRGDYCRLYLDGILQYSITRSPSWATITFGIPDGEHVVGWSYERGSASAAGEDAAFLSNLIWQPLSITVALVATNLVWSPDGDEPWIPQLSVTVDGMAAVQSGPVIGDGVSALRTTLSGPGVLSWSWLLDSSGNAGVDVLLDGVWLDSYAPGSQWTRETLEVTDNGEHTIRFEFWNAGTAATITDCAYIDQVSWTPATPQAVVVCGVDIPTDWLSNEAATILTANGGNYDSAANATAANGVNKVWECYVAGISPTNAAAAFRTIVSFENGVPVIGWEPDLNEGGTKHERVYTVEGKENLADSWAPTNSASRFFRVKVEMP